MNMLKLPVKLYKIDTIWTARCQLLHQASMVEIKSLNNDWPREIGIRYKWKIRVKELGHIIYKVFFNRVPEN